MGIFNSFAISGSGLTAERFRLDLISNNIANMETTGRPGDPANPPYRRKIPLFAQMLEQTDGAGRYRSGSRGAGVRVAGVVNDPAPPRLVYEPDHPQADNNGYVAYPEINIVNEMVNLISATRSYEANVTTLNAAKEIFLKALDIGRG